MKATDTDSVVGRRPRHTTTDFEMETDVAVIEQLVRAEYLVKSGMIDGKQVLDVGCGHGYTMLFFKKNGQAVTVVGLETDRDLVANNNLTYKGQGIESMYYDGNAFPFQDGSFDVVTCFEVLEHVDSSVQQNLVKEMARVVRNEGVVVISTPNKPVYSPDGISLNPDHINEIDKYVLDNLCNRYFDSVEIHGQCYSRRERLRARQRRHLLSHTTPAMIMRSLGVPHLFRLARRLRPKKTMSAYRSEKNNFRIDTFVNEETLVLIAICKRAKKL